MKLYRIPLALGHLDQIAEMARIADESCLFKPLAFEQIHAYILIEMVRERDPFVQIESLTRVAGREPHTGRTPRAKIPEAVSVGDPVYWQNGEIVTVDHSEMSGAISLSNGEVTTLGDLQEIARVLLWRQPKRVPDYVDRVFELNADRKGLGIVPERLIAWMEESRRCPVWLMSRTDVAWVMSRIKRAARSQENADALYDEIDTAFDIRKRGAM